MAVLLSSPSSSVFGFSNSRAASSRHHASAASALGPHYGALQGSTTGTRSAGGVAMLGTSLLLSSVWGSPLSCGDEQIKGSGKERRSTGPASSGATVQVRASSIGVVKEVASVSKEPLFYGVTLTVPSESEVASWYKTPGQYVTLLPAESQRPRGSVFFLVSPPPVRSPKQQNSELEFLVEDVPNTVANEIINSKPGDRVVIDNTTYPSTGFDLSTLNSIEESQSVLMFASGFGLGPFRALIEKGFDANKRKHAILYALYTPDQTPYVNRFPRWEQTGVQVRRGPLDNIIETNPANTVVLMVASTRQQEELATYFGKKGVSEDRILTLFPGIPTSDKSYYNKVLHYLNYYPNFPHHSQKHVPVELTI